MAILFHQQDFSVDKLLETIEKESQIATEWYKENSVILNADKSQAVVVNRNSDMSNH